MHYFDIILEHKLVLIKKKHVNRFNSALKVNRICLHVLGSWRTANLTMETNMMVLVSVHNANVTVLP